MNKKINPIIRKYSEADARETGILVSETFKLYNSTEGTTSAIQKYVANTCGFALAATTNYFMNRMWTFHSTNPNVMLEFSRFFIIALIGLLINLLIIWTMTGKFKVNFYVSKLVATLLVTLWNFMINAYYTFA